MNKRINNLLNTIENDNRVFYAVIVLFFILFILMYIFVSPVYRYQHTDDTWGLAWQYTYLNEGRIANPVFGTGLNSLDLFGMLRTAIYGNILNIVGWTKTNAHFISLFIMLFAHALWILLLKEIGFKKKTIIGFLLLILAFEPIFNSSFYARPDALNYFLIAFSLYLFIKEQYLFSGFAILVGIETHPVAITGCFYILAYTIYNWKNINTDRKALIKKVLLFITGIILGLFYYFLLHGIPIDKFLNKVNSGASDTGTADNYLVEFFFFTKLRRHIPELILFSFAGIVYLVKKLYKENSFPGLLFLCIVFSTFIIPIGNFNYAIFAYPAFALLLIYTASKISLRNLMLMGVFCLLFPQYLYIYQKNKGWNFEEYVAKIQKIVPEDDLHIFGGPSEWFAFLERDYHEVRVLYRSFEGNSYVLESPPNEFYFIHRVENGRNHGEFNKDLSPIDYKVEKISSLEYQKMKVTVYKYMKNDY